MMELKFEKLRVSDIEEASELVNRVFLSSVALTLTQEGVDTFQVGMMPGSISNRLRDGNRILVCKQNGSIVAVGEIRDQNHLNLLFVEPSMQRKGVGRQLFRHLIRGIQNDTITVNSSINSVDAYKTMGFEASAEVVQVKGIRSQAMVYHRSK